MGKRRVLLDTRPLIAMDGNVSHRFWAAEKLGQPVLEGDRPWERYGVQVYGSVFLDGGRYRMWYNCAPEVPTRANFCHVGYAESSDGVRWEKLVLGIDPFADTKETNLLNLYRHFPSVMIDSSEPDPPIATRPRVSSPAAGHRKGAASIRRPASTPPIRPTVCAGPIMSTSLCR